MLSKFLKIWQPKEDDPKNPGKKKLAEKVDMGIELIPNMSVPENQEAKKQELINAYKDPRVRNRMMGFLPIDLIDVRNKEGIDRIKNAPVNVIQDNKPFIHDYSGLYEPYQNKINLINSENADKTAELPNTLTHELTHAYQGDRKLNKIQRFINSNLSQDRKDQWGFGQKRYDYLTDEGEVRARLNELRSVRDPNNYWKEWTIDDLNDDKHYIPALDDLQQVMDDEQIVKLLNELATNEENKMRRFINLG